eukprot:Opistho-2@20599
MLSAQPPQVASPPVRGAQLLINADTTHATHSAHIVHTTQANGPVDSIPAAFVGSARGGRDAIKTTGTKRRRTASDSQGTKTIRAFFKPAGRSTDDEEGAD